MRFFTCCALLLAFSSTCSSGTVYYISPDIEACYGGGVNDTILPGPCYLLHQLSNKTLSSNITNLTLLLLPGIHTIPPNKSVTFFNIQWLELRPLHEEQEVVIKCGMLVRFYYHKVCKLEISYVSFIFCTSQHATKGCPNEQVSIVKCTFKESRNDGAIVLSEVDYSIKSKISVYNSTFISNNGAIVSNIINLYVYDTLFVNNWRNEQGGSIFYYYESGSLQIYRCEFRNNTAAIGGAIYSLASTFMMVDTIFESNRAMHGGAIYSRITDTSIENCYFFNNSASYGGAVTVFDDESTVTLNVNSTVFLNNHAAEYGGAIYSHFSQHVKLSTNIFHNNSAMSGGAISSYENGYLSIRNNIFLNNFASISGGGVDSESADILDSQFFNNSARISGGAIYFKNMQQASSITKSTFYFNQGTYGGAICCNSTVTSLSLSNGSAESNSAASGGFLYLLDSHVRLNGECYVGNSAVSGGAIYAVNSDVFFRSNIVLFTHNTAVNYGGALFLNNSYIHDPQIIFTHNTVQTREGKGGAIFIQDKATDCELHAKCFMTTASLTANLTFNNNNAAYGAILYGGLLNYCRLSNTDRSYLFGIDYFKQISQYETSPYAITSDSVQLCLCNEGFKTNCSQRELNVVKMRGAVINVIVASVDQNEKPVKSVINAQYEEFNTTELDKGEGKRSISNKCTGIDYHIYTISKSATLVLETEGICQHSLLSKLTLHIELAPCGRGFQQQNDTCVCKRRLTQFNISDCKIDVDAVQKKGSIWLRYDEQYLRIHINCPLDYCQVTSNTISLSAPDQQCANHHAGVICGGCQDGYSIALGSSNCLKCISRHTIWLVVVFALAGVALVSLLLICNMTISTGSLNGLIFYANVVSISGVTLQNNCSIHVMLTVFIAWLNLDFGVETCFYPGMSIYQKTWLQFAFPLYIWLLVGVIIIASYYSTKAMKIFGRNNIAILATLFLLSYSKMLKTIISALNFTQVLRGSAENVSDPLLPYKVWTYDGNIEYLDRRHTALFVVALLLLLFLFLPYTLLLTFGQCVRSLQVKRKFRWIYLVIRSTAFVSILDAYHAPYHNRHRYWTGLMLLTRCVLFLTFATSHRDSDILTNMYVTTLVITGILVVRIFSGNAYKNFLMGVLELCFLVNLVVLSSTLSYLKRSSIADNTICRIVHASLSISFSLFLVILGYHTYLKVKNRTFFIHIKNMIYSRWFVAKRHNSLQRESDPHGVVYHGNTKLPTASEFQLREELLASDKQN